MKGWQAHSTLNWSWVLSLQSQIRLLSDLSTEEQVFVGGQETKRPTHKVHSPHQRFEPPGTVILSPATVLARVLARAARDKRTNNIFLYWGNELCRAGKKRERKRTARHVAQPDLVHPDPA